MDGRRKRLCGLWDQGGELVTNGLELLQQTTEKVRLIQDQMSATHSRQKSYTDKRRKPFDL